VAELVRRLGKHPGVRSRNNVVHQRGVLMATVTALLDLKIKPESVAEAKETVESVLVATRAFPGCLGVDVLVDTEDKAHLLVIEKWESIEHDQAYRDWRATPAGTSALGTIVASRSLTRFVTA
jgi:heme oxygenase (mycobilin-producing)